MKHGRPVPLAAAALAAALLAQAPARAQEDSKEPAKPETPAPTSTTETPPSDAPPSDAPPSDAPPSTRARAAEKGRRAMTSYRAGQYEEAYAFFRDANEVFHTPQLVLYMARCQDKRGKLLEARALYERVLSEPLPEAPSDSLVRARQAATAELGPVRLRIPTLAVDVRGPAPSEVTLFVDGEVWPLDEPREIDPGPHEVEALSRSGARTNRSVELPEGRSISIVLRLGLFAKSAPARTEFVAPDDKIPTWRAGLISVGFTVGLVNLAVGATAGAFALQAKDVVEAQCISNKCSRQGLDAADRARSLANWSNASFALAAVGVAAGVVGIVFPAEKKQALRAGLGVVGPGVGIFAGGAF